MKQLFILSAILTLCPGSLFAQFEKGKHAIGLSLALGYNDNGASGRTIKSDRDYTVAPLATYEYFMHRNLSLITGIDFMFNHREIVREFMNSNQQSYMETTERNTQSISPLMGIKKYFFNETGKFGIFISPYAMVGYQVFYNRSSNNNPQAISPTSFYSLEEWTGFVNANLGFCYFISPNLSLELNSQVMRGTITTSYKRFWLGPDLGNIKYGARYYF